jgi:hypothetical protein
MKQTMHSGRSIAAGVVFLVIGPLVGALAFLAVFFLPVGFGRSSRDTMEFWGWLTLPVAILIAPVTAGLCCAWLLRRLRLPMAAVPGLAFAAGYFGIALLAYFPFVFTLSSRMH